MTHSYYVEYWSTDPLRCMLGATFRSQTSRFESRADAQTRLDGIIDVHAKLDRPLIVAGVINESDLRPEIYSDGSTIGCNWGKAKGRSRLRKFDLYWSPEGRKIATVEAITARAAIRKAPQPYRRYLGEIYAQETE